MKIGYLGTGNTSKDVVFQVSDKTVKTFSNMKITKQANLTSHKIHGGKAVTELNGFDAGSATFDMVMSAFLGINPRTELKKLTDLFEKGTVCLLVLGDDIYGKWLIKTVSQSIQYVYKDGTPTQIKTSVTLTEAGDTA